MDIRPFRQSDVEALAELMGELGYPTSTESMRKRMIAIESSSMDATFVAEMDDQVIGMIGARLVINYEHDYLIMQIVALVTKAEYRGIGAGSALIKHAEDWGIQHGVIAVILNSGIKPERVIAHEFYKNQGYDITGYRFLKGIRAIHT